MSGVMTDHMCSTMAAAEHTEAKMAASLAGQDGRVKYSEWQIQVLGLVLGQPLREHKRQVSNITARR